MPVNDRERNPATLEPESALRQQLRDILLMSPFEYDHQLLAEVKRLKALDVKRSSV